MRALQAEKDEGKRKQVQYLRQESPAALEQHEVKSVIMLIAVPSASSKCAV
jgi:hypothetical protein